MDLIGGGFSEKQQGTRLVAILDSIDRLGLAGAVVNSWQDDWTNITGSMEIVDQLDKNMSGFWYNAQASDEAFGLIAFEKEKENKNIYLDGNIDEWDSLDYIIDDQIKLKLRSEPSYLYLMLEKPGLKFEREDIYIGLDVTPKSGSDYWAKKEASFDLPVDFIIHLAGYRNSRVLVHERYNIFDYLYKYYSPVVDSKDQVPASDGDEFSPIYALNRKRFYFSERDKIAQPIYYETGKLRHGNDNPSYSNFNSLADYKVVGDHVEIKIPWDMINIKNPIEMSIYDDFYLEGLEKSLKNNSIGLSLYDKKEDRTYASGKVHKLERNRKKREYIYRFKKSYFVLKDYWSE